MESIRKIPLKQIDLADETFSVNFMADLQRIRSSIEEVGVLQPVLLKEKRDGFQIVCGFRRISVLKELLIPEVKARVLEEKERDDLSLFSIALHENLTTRGLNTVEKAIALDKLIHRFKLHRSDVIAKILPLFSLETSEKILNTYLLLAGIEDEVKRFVAEEEVSRSNIRRLAAFSADDRKAFLSLVSPLKLGENRLREVLTFLEEITRRDQVTVEGVIGRPEIQSILCQEELTPSQRTEKVKTLLMRSRYPRMYQLEERFEAKRKELNLPVGVTLRHPPFFEGKGLKIELQCETMEQYRMLLSALAGLQEKKTFQEILEEG